MESIRRGRWAPESSRMNADDRLSLRRSVGLKAATAPSRVETLPMFVRSGFTPEEVGKKLAASAA